MRIHKLVCAALAVAVAICCSSITFSQKAEKPPERELPTQEVIALSESNNEFGLELLAQVREDDKNVVISPASVAMCLQLLATAAEGETETQLRKMLHVEGTDLGAANRALLDHWKDRAGVKLEVANGVWVNPKRMTPNEQFIKGAREGFDAEISALDFASPTAKATINEWISEHTGKKIQKMIETLEAEDPCVIANAIYLKAEWKTPFSVKKSKQQTFHAPSGDSEDVWVMHSKKKFWKYYSDAEVEAIRLPFIADKFASMWIFLPAEGTDADELATEMDTPRLKQIFNQARLTRGKIGLPRFKVRTKTQLNDSLKALGMVKAFDRITAEFDKLGDNGGKGFFVQDVLHEAVVEVDEKGAEAAAATVVRMGCGGGAPPKPFKMTCDRPFFFVIRDDQSGALMFMGLIQNPEQ